MAASGFAGLVPYAINFSIVAGAAIYFGREPLRKFVFQRHERFKDLVESAAKAQEAAEKRFAEVMKSIEGVDSEVSQLLKEAEVEAKSEAQEVLQRAQADADRLAVDSDRTIERERSAQLQKIKRTIILKSLTDAEAKLRKGMNPEVHTQMLKVAKAQIEASV